MIVHELALEIISRSSFLSYYLISYLVAVIPTISRAVLKLAVTQRHMG